MSGNPLSGETGTRGDDVYTYMIIIAAAFVWIAAIFAIVTSVSLFGSLLPPAGG